MSDIYLVTSGDYSDYRVEGAFSSRENAQEYINAGGKNITYNEDKRIEVYPVDEYTRHLREGLRIYHVAMYLDGETKPERSYSKQGELGDESYGIRIGRREVDKLARIEDSLSFSVVARDLKHATKIVNEKRVELLANDYLPLPYDSKLRQYRTFDTYQELIDQLVEDGQTIHGKDENV